ncbi:NRDE family protein [Microbacter sp. GSS18]|nr:NRDE family protein [Microbacter sp. GSS18]
MCTVIVHVPGEGRPTRMLAVRDEDPARPWNAPGPWWPERHPGVVGIRDVRAGGAWLAADPEPARLAVLLNRIDLSDRADDDVVSRGGVVLDAVAGLEPAAVPATRGFNLVEVDPNGSRVITWDGLERREVTIAPGTHMIAHDDLDDPTTARITAWLDAFRAAEPDPDAPANGPDAWWRPWMRLLDERSRELGPDDDRAIIRDNRAHGFPTLSLLVCAASVADGDVSMAYGELAEPGRWNTLVLE